jgi:hypothetical protein
MAPGAPALAYQCPNECSLQTGAAAASSGLQAQPALVMGPGGPSVTMGVCLNTTRWSLCSSRVTEVRASVLCWWLALNVGAEFC